MNKNVLAFIVAAVVVIGVIVVALQLWIPGVLKTSLNLDPGDPAGIKCTEAKNVCSGNAKNNNATEVASIDQKARADAKAAADVADATKGTVWNDVYDRVFNSQYKHLTSEADKKFQTAEEKCRAEYEQCALDALLKSVPEKVDLKASLVGGTAQDSLKVPAGKRTVTLSWTATVSPCTGSTEDALSSWNKLIYPYTGAQQKDVNLPIIFPSQLSEVTYTLTCGARFVSDSVTITN